MKQNEPGPSIREAHDHLTNSLPFDDTTDFDSAERGFLGSLDDAAIRNAAGDIVWDAASYDFLDADAPASVNPSLWR
jgi:alkyl sulfatase BDS1-like metallo-beta-lactamase superfamily hydrolase